MPASMPHAGAATSTAVVDTVARSASRASTSRPRSRRSSDRGPRARTTCRCGDQHTQVAKALYSLPRQYAGRILRARADQHTVRFYDGAVLVKTHPRAPAGGRATDAIDFPTGRTWYA